VPHYCVVKWDPREQREHLPLLEQLQAHQLLVLLPAVLLLLVVVVLLLPC
jgi:hypothetical protein